MCRLNCARLVILMLHMIADGCCEAGTWLWSGFLSVQSLSFPGTKGAASTLQGTDVLCWGVAACSACCFPSTPRSLPLNEAGLKA